MRVTTALSSLRRWASALGVAVLLVASHGTALAQSTATPVVTGYLSTSGCPYGQTTCFVQFGASGGGSTYTGPLAAQLPASLGAKTGANSLSIVPATDATLPAVGNVAAAVADSGNPVKIGAKYNATPPTYTDGQRTDAQSNAAGSLKVALTSTAGAEINSSAPADGRSTPSSSLATAGFLELWNNTNWIYARGDANGAVSQPYAMTANRWQYAAASGGIANTTTAVTIASAAGAGIRNYITAIQISNDTLGSATELVVRDGAAGTVIWRMKIGTAVDSGISIVFPVPLKGTANNLLEVATLTATVTGGVYVNAQGFSGI